ncbi:NLRC5 [Branchiostoma lanceolatum]|uniref:NLRC5 protein n=1 Tax=Branchiostoma lanceolatum TaxID=7740 RepID=A0A8J9WG90_BRALA|nr:NLRC5 [Branchiostoma lanceolatum]
MEVPNTIGNLEVKTPEAKVEKKPPLLKKEGVKRKRASVQSSWAEDELERLYESRKTAEGRDDPRRSQNCCEFFLSRLGCMLAVCVGVIVVVTAAVVPNLTTLSTTSTTSSTQSVTSPATSKTTSDHWAEWTLYIREYFQQDSDAATGLEERYPDNEVVMALLEDRFFWHWVCRYWECRPDLPHTLSDAITYCIRFGTSKTLQNNDYRHYTSLSLSGLILSDNDVEALANLFPYLKGVEYLHLSRCGLSAKAAKSLAGQLHLLHALNALDLSSNNIGDDGLEAISDTFSHLKELRTFYVMDNSITNVGGRALAKRLVHLQELQNIALARNELALSLSLMAKAFVNMARLESVGLWPITCRADSFRMAAQQARDAVHTPEGQVRSTRSVLLYDASTGSTGGTRESDAAWQGVEQELTTGVYISNGKMKIRLQIKLLEE